MACTNIVMTLGLPKMYFSILQNNQIIGVEELRGERIHSRGFGRSFQHYFMPEPVSLLWSGCTQQWAKNFSLRAQWEAAMIGDPPVG